MTSKGKEIPVGASEYVYGRVQSHSVRCIDWIEKGYLESFLFPTSSDTLKYYFPQRFGERFSVTMFSRPRFSREALLGVGGGPF